MARVVPIDEMHSEASYYSTDSYRLQPGISWKVAVGVSVGLGTFIFIALILAATGDDSLSFWKADRRQLQTFRDHDVGEVEQHSPRRKLIERQSGVAPVDHNNILAYYSLGARSITSGASTPENRRLQQDDSHDSTMKEWLRMIFV